mgnify:CR=1 FL=1
MAWKQFAQLPIEAITDERIRGNKLLVLCTVLSFCDKHGVSKGWTRKDMAGRCGLPETRFSSVTSELEAIGWLKKIGSGGRSMPCEYQVTIPKTVTESVTLSSASPAEETVCRRFLPLRYRGLAPTRLGVRAGHRGVYPEVTSTTPADRLGHTPGCCRDRVGPFQTPSLSDRRHQPLRVRLRGVLARPPRGLRRVATVRRQAQGREG